MSPTRFLSVAPVFPVDDVPASVRWYREKLAFEVAFENRDPEGLSPTNYAVIRRGETCLHLVRKAEAPAKIQRAQAQFTVDGDVNALLEQIRHDVSVVQEARDQPWGCRDFMIADPDDNLIWISTIAR